MVSSPPTTPSTTTANNNSVTSPNVPAVHLAKVKSPDLSQGSVGSSTPVKAASNTESATPPMRPRVSSTSSGGDPAEWTVEDVIRHIEGVDSNLAIHADIFRKHVSDFRP